MASKWKKVRAILGLNMCTVVPRTSDDTDPDGESGDTPPVPALCTRIRSKRVSESMTTGTESTMRPIWRSGNPTLKKTCTICLGAMRRRDGHAIFTAECGHSFHFYCITANVNHGNQICPICRAKWKEIPLRTPQSSDPPRLISNSTDWFSPHPPQVNRTPEPAIFDDDETLESSDTLVTWRSYVSGKSDPAVEINVYPELSSAPKSKNYDEFTVLVNVKAASASGEDERIRAPVDLVTVLDTSGSMAGTKLSLLKRAMLFVIQNLSSKDRLSIVAFSSTARRILPLCRMTDSGREKAVQAVTSLVAGGGTNIGDGLRKVEKILDQRKETNVVSSIILLSDGQDTYNPNPDHPYLPGSRVPVHTFGFGSDHDASLMHSISEISGGTFSFIETEGVIQNAFAQCIGGLLSVVLPSLQVEVHSLNDRLKVKAGSYPVRISGDGSAGFIDAGDVYADEERNFLVTIPLPADRSSLIKVVCLFKHPVTLERVRVEVDDVSIPRNDGSVEPAVSPEVDLQRNRLLASEAIQQARAAAERGDFAGAGETLALCRQVMAESLCGRVQDRLWKCLDAELKEMQDRMANWRMYEASGRAFVLSGLSSHSWQRATARGDTTEDLNIGRPYQTPSMTEMISRSQALL